MADLSRLEDAIARGGYQALLDRVLIPDGGVERGGDAFDNTAFVYGSSKHEALLSQWMRNRGIHKGGGDPRQGRAHAVLHAIRLDETTSDDFQGRSRAGALLVQRGQLRAAALGTRAG